MITYTPPTEIVQHVPYRVVLCVPFSAFLIVFLILIEYQASDRQQPILLNSVKTDGSTGSASDEFQNSGQQQNHRQEDKDSHIHFSLDLDPLPHPDHYLPETGLYEQMI